MLRLETGTVSLRVWSRGGDFSAHGAERFAEGDQGGRVGREAHACDVRLPESKEHLMR